MNRVAVILAFLSWAAFAAAPSDLDVARRALGDGLWSVAARHAAAAANAATSLAARDAARQVELEALAGANEAAGILARLEAWTDATGDSFRYWKAWALVASNRGAEAAQVLKTPFEDLRLSVLALRLQARIAASTGDRASATDYFGKASAALVSNATARVENAVEWAQALDAFEAPKEALEVLRGEGAVAAAGSRGDEARLLSAELLEKTGNSQEGRRVRETLLAGGTNTSERVYVLAACGLSRNLLAGGATNEALRVASNAVARAQRSDLACHAGFTLGFGLFALPDARAAGRELISRTVRNFPENPASGGAQLRLADQLLEAGNAADAVTEYDALLQSFPNYALDAHVLEGRGWALLRLGRRAEAVGLFARAAQVTTNAEVKARCVFKQAEALVADGRHEEAAAVFGAVGEGELHELSRFRRADALVRARQMEAARKELEALFLAGGEMAVESGLRLAAMESSLGHVERAAEAYGLVLGAEEGRQPTSEQRVRALMGRGRALYRACRFKDAERDFHAVADLEPRKRDEMGFLVALCLYGDGRDKEACEAMETLLQSVTDACLRGEVQFWLSKYHAGRREWEAAIEGFESFASQEGVPETRRIEALVRAANCAAALPDYEKVVAITGRAVPNGVAADATPQANPELPFQAEALVLQGEALVELARFDDAKLVFERVGNLQVSEALKRRASLKRADCLFAMGADDANRYRAALDAYRALLREDDLSDSLRIVVAFKAARSMEKLRRQEEAIDFYYQNVVLVYYWEALRPDSEDSTQRHWFDGNARDLFARAALTVGDYYESRGELKTAVQVLGYLVAARMPASEQAAARIARIKEKGGL